MNVIFHAVDPVQMTIPVFDNPPDEFKEPFTTCGKKNRTPSACCEDNMIIDLIKRRHRCRIAYTKKFVKASIPVVLHTRLPTVSASGDGQLSECIPARVYRSESVCHWIAPISRQRRPWVAAGVSLTD